MANYLLVEARDPFDSIDVEGAWDLAEALVDNGDEVTVYLVQQGVGATRPASTKAARLSQLASKATVLADDFSLRERGIATDALADGVAVATMDDLVDRTATPGTKVIWH